jgi:hypothetical protein
MPETAELAATLTLTESREAQLEFDKKRLNLHHSIVLHRDAVSANDIKTMLAHLEAAGMPADATLRVDGSDGHTRMYATWHEALPVVASTPEGQKDA